MSNKYRPRTLEVHTNTLHTRPHRWRKAHLRHGQTGRHPVGPVRCHLVEVVAARLEEAGEGRRQAEVVRIPVGHTNKKQGCKLAVKRYKYTDQD